ncbi:MAG: AAA family ATPase, partial [Desulfurococcales archaeon]|nr:AAA family ATPase [Desulfurococcales archaeon]
MEAGGLREVFKRVLVEFEERGLPKLVERELRTKSSPLTAVVGPRRAGKTYYFFQLIKDLGGLPKCLYVDFEHELLVGVKSSELRELLVAFRELYGCEPEYVFLDEVQVVEGWERFVRRLRDSGQYRVYVTGSSSKLLAREIATQLRGRAITYLLLPFSFREYLRALNVRVDLRLIDYSDRVRGEVLHYLSKYVSEGGFPELVLKREVYSELLYSIR